MVAVRVKAVERRAGAYLSFWLYLMRQIRYSVEYIWQNLPNRRSVTATHHPSLWSEAMYVLPETSVSSDFRQCQDIFFCRKSAFGTAEGG